MQNLPPAPTPVKRPARKLAAGTFWLAPTAMLFDRRCGLTEIRVVGYIAMHGDDAFPSYDAMARDLDIHKRTAREAVKDAREHGYLTTEPRIVPGAGYRGLIYTVLYPEPGAPLARTRSGGRVRLKPAPAQGEPGAGGASLPGAPVARTELYSENNTMSRAAADARLDSAGGGGRDDAPSDVADDHGDAARARELAGGLAPAPDSRGEAHEPEARHDKTSTREAPDQTGVDDLAIPDFLKRPKAPVKSEEVRHDAGAPGKPGCRVPAELLAKRPTVVARKGPAPQPVTVGDVMQGLARAFELWRAAA